VIGEHVVQGDVGEAEDEVVVVVGLGVEEVVVAEEDFKYARAFFGSFWRSRMEGGGDQILALAFEEVNSWLWM